MFEQRVVVCRAFGFRVWGLRFAGFRGFRVFGV